MSNAQSNIKEFKLPAVSNRFDSMCFQNLNETEGATLIELATNYLRNKHRKGSLISSPGDTQEYLRLRLSEMKHEVFGVIFLDTRHRIIVMEELFRGTVDGASVPVREVVIDALKHNASAVIFYHNHPSGVVAESQADLRLTERLSEALGMVDIRVLDHFIVGSEGVTSMAEKGLI